MFGIYANTGEVSHKKTLSKRKQITHWRWGWGEAGTWERTKKLSKRQMKEWVTTAKLFILNELICYQDK